MNTQYWNNESSLSTAAAEIKLWQFMKWYKCLQKLSSIFTQPKVTLGLMHIFDRFILKSMISKLLPWTIYTKFPWCFAKRMMEDTPPWQYIATWGLKPWILSRVCSKEVIWMWRAIVKRRGRSETRKICWSFHTAVSQHNKWTSIILKQVCQLNWVFVHVRKSVFYRTKEEEKMAIWAKRGDATIRGGC